jgi:hypothetical protein
MRFTVTKLFCLAILFCALVVSSVWAQAKRSEVAAKGQTSGSGGTAEFVINGETQAATYTVEMLEAPSVTEDGARRERTAHRFVFADGSSLTTEETVTMTPTSTPGVYKMMAVSRITEGTGSHEKARGQMVLRGDRNTDSSEDDWTAKGSICSPCE